MVESKRLKSLQSRDNFPQHPSTKAALNKTQEAIAKTKFKPVLQEMMETVAPKIYDAANIEQATNPIFLDKVHQAIIDKNFNQLGEILGNLNRDFYGNLGKAYFLRFGAVNHFRLLVLKI